MLQTRFNLFLLYHQKVKGNDVQKAEKKNPNFMIILEYLSLDSHINTLSQG